MRALFAPTKRAWGRYEQLEYREIAAASHFTLFAAESRPSTTACTPCTRMAWLPKTIMLAAIIIVIITPWTLIAKNKVANITKPVKIFFVSIYR
jgi:hypothetical protein